MNPTCALPGILVVEPDDELRDIISNLLTEEGYEVQAVSSLDDALKLLDTRLFHLALVDLFIGRSPHAFTEGHVLRRRVHPIPVGLLSTQNISPEEAIRQGFAFLLREPFEIETLLSLVAAAINQPLSTEQEHLAEIVRRFFTALENDDWHTLAAICTEDLIYYAPPQSPFAPTRKIQGLDAYQHYVETAKRGLPHSRFHAIMIFARPKGLGARYQLSWTPPDGMPQQMVGTTLFLFRGEAISQMNICLNSQHLRALMNEQKIG